MEMRIRKWKMSDCIGFNDTLELGIGTLQRILVRHCNGAMKYRGLSEGHIGYQLTGNYEMRCLQIAKLIFRILLIMMISRIARSAARRYIPRWTDVFSCLHRGLHLETRLAYRVLYSLH